MYACKYFSSVHNNFVNTKPTTVAKKHFLQHNQNCYITDFFFLLTALHFCILKELHNKEKFMW